MKTFPHYLQHDVMDCGPTCLRMIAAFYGKRYSLEGLREKSFITREGASVSLLADDENTYTVTVNLPQDLRTSYGKVLNFKGELVGTAEVMTDERSLMERIVFAYNAFPAYRVLTTILFDTLVK